MTYIIVDLEGTCCNDDSIPDNERETIEIGAVITDRDYVEISNFQIFIRPTRHKNLTPFCMNLTSISQKDVEQALVFPAAWHLFLSWMNQFSDSLFCSWGSYDRKQLKRDCEFWGFPYPFSDHCDLSNLFTKKIGRRGTHRKAMKILGLKAIGTHHRGLDDAKNIVKMLPFLMNSG